MASHLSSLTDEVVRELAVADPEYWVEDEDLAGTEGADDLVDEVVVPWNISSLAVLRTPRWLCSLIIPGFDHHANGLERVRDDGTLRWAYHIRLAAQDQYSDSDVEHAEAHEVGGPKTLVFLHERRGQQAQAAKIDTPIEDHINPLVCDRRIDNGPLSALLDFNGHLVALVLICNQRRNVGLNATSTEADDDDRSNVTAERMAMGQRRGKRSSPEDEQADPVNAAEEHNGLVAAEVLISNDGTEDWCDVAEELEEEVEPSGSLKAKTDTHGAIGAVFGVEDVVLEETLAAVVCKALAEFDNSNQESGRWQVLANATEMLLLVFGRLVAFCSFLAGLSVPLSHDFLVCSIVDTPASDETASYIGHLAIWNLLFQALMNAVVKLLAGVFNGSCFTLGAVANILSNSNFVIGHGCECCSCVRAASQVSSLLHESNSDRRLFNGLTREGWKRKKVVVER